jgi:prepilin-type N-terminal cleavage/methylation domain-containing protein
MKKSLKENGFTAIELLITLFIAVAFIATGYQLYTVIVTNGTTVRTKSIASNIAYANLREYAALTVNPCVATSTPTPAPTITTNSGLTNPSITVTYSCPYATIPSITKVQVTVLYGNSTPQQEVDHAIFVSH